MFACIVLGVELPITATYITTSAICAPALSSLGVDPLTANLFIFFFSAVSGMTPPVCVTAYAAAGVARAGPLTVGFTAMRLGAIAYIVPYMFVYGQPLLMRESVGQIAFSIVTAIIGIVCFCTGIYGWFFKKINYNGGCDHRKNKILTVCILKKYL
jgi:TRAP-type uncharacterized transport system fused permease subunit